MSTLIKHLSVVASFFNNIMEAYRDHVEKYYYPVQKTSLEQTYWFDYTPNDSNTTCLVYTRLYQTFKQIEDTDLFKTLLNEMQYANILKCDTWDTRYTLQDIPNELDAPFENTIITGGERLAYTVWVLWFDDRVEIVKPYPNRGIYRSNCEVFESREKADVMPEGVVKAAKITIGVVESGNILKGYQWTLYNRNK